MRRSLSLAVCSIFAGMPGAALALAMSVSTGTATLEIVDIENLDTPGDTTDLLFGGGADVVSEFTDSFSEPGSSASFGSVSSAGLGFLTVLHPGVTLSGDIALSAVATGSDAFAEVDTVIEGIFGGRNFSTTDTMVISLQLSWDLLVSVTVDTPPADLALGFASVSLEDSVNGLLLDEAIFADSEFGPLDDSSMGVLPFTITLGPGDNLEGGFSIVANSYADVLVPVPSSIVLFAALLLLRRRVNGLPRS